MSELTVMQAFEDVVGRAGDTVALRRKSGGKIEETTWKEYGENVRAVAKALIKAGVQPREGVAIVGFNSPEWLYADLGAIFAGAIPAGIYTTSSGEQAAYIVDHCDARVAFVDSAEQAEKLVAEKARMPKLEQIVQWAGKKVAADLVVEYNEFVAAGKDVDDRALEARIAAQKAADPCTLIYTSGTTGNPKGVLLSHDNLTWTAKASLTLGFQPTDCGVSYLPLSHIAEQMLTVHVPMCVGSMIHFAESLEKMPEALVEARPAYFLGVPRVWEKMQAKMEAGLAKAPPMRKRIARWARGVGLRAGYAHQRGEGRPAFFGLANALVFSKLRARLGLDRCRFALTGAAPISKDTLEFFLGFGLPLYEVYGMSECTGPATQSLPDAYRTGWVGKVLTGGEIKIADDGEILVRGRHVFLGYAKDEAATREAIDEEGWLHTGDVGEIDEEGYARVTDRKKELLITAGGENVAPQLVEGLLKSIPVVAQAVVVGDRQKYLAALITLDPERVELEAREAGSDARDVRAAAECETFRAHVEKQIERVNERLARVQTIKRFTILPSELTVDGGELTPTLKLKRKIIVKKYAKEIESMYV
ncbi:MAG TPA: AMP-binding protein [Polyangiaceae bacterium]|jgi:long-subunit acyl-CoA synthetase (AMP-forming)